MKLNQLWRGLLALGLAAATAGCHGTTTPHAEYFVVTFRPGAPAPSEEGRDALANAVSDARRHEPREITIAGAEPAPGAAPALAEARAKAIEAEFTKAGINPSTIFIEIRPAAEQDYAARQDSFILTLAFGVPQS